MLTEACSMPAMGLTRAATMGTIPDLAAERRMWGWTSELPTGEENGTVGDGKAEALKD